MTCRSQVALAVAIMGLSLATRPVLAEGSATSAPEQASAAAAPAAPDKASAATAAPAAAAAKPAAPAASAPAKKPVAEVGERRLGWGNALYVVIAALAALAVALIYYAMRDAGMTEKAKDEGGQ